MLIVKQRLNVTLANSSQLISAVEESICPRKEVAAIWRGNVKNIEKSTYGEQIRPPSFAANA